MNELLFYGHGGSGNSGCEAIVRTTVQRLKNAIPDSSVMFSTIDVSADKVWEYP